MVNHPVDCLLRADRIPHIWCSGCGLGIAVHSFLRAALKSGIPREKLVVVSGIGCTGRVGGYLNVDSFHTTHGRAIPFATGLKLANPGLKVVVFSGDGDLIAIGGNHFIHAARRNVDITVVCVNNFNYGMTGGQCAPTTPLKARTTTTPSENPEPPFNLAYLAAGSGAVFVARWTVVETVKLERSITKALNKNGFSFVEIISPCPTLYGKFNKMATGLNMMKDYQKNTVVCDSSKGQINVKDVQIDLGGRIVVGDFIDIERPSFVTTDKHG
ncbi:MAG: 2-oxoacid:ferredoxin oxidoreductase subunit beta [Planctomycetes bacterium]|nr:2-oxoacid:ferredoxin oxidoreductase subunit beta [Planctomycetota bacterium]